MKLITILVALAALAVVPAFAEDDFFIKYVPNLNVGDSFINITNTGAVQGKNLQGGLGAPAQKAKNGNICVNIYVFSPDEQEVDCCSCLLTPNGLATFSVKGLVALPLTPVIPSDVVIKLVPTAACIPQATGGCFPQSSPANCDASTAGLQPTYDAFGNLDLTASTAFGQPVAPGLVAWGTALHANTSPVGGYQVTETPFEKGELSNGELNRITGLCANIQANGSGFGICPRDHGFCVTPTPPAIR
jgi:hypothetical protein